jgi:kynurenine formamidase
VKPVIDSMHTMAKGGVLTQRVDCVQHTGTHADAPRHVMEREFNGKRARYTHEMPVDAYTGDAVCLEIQIEKWGLILPEHLEDACKRAGVGLDELEGMVICLNTGMHRLFDDSMEYYQYACGTGLEAGKWFVKHKVKCVAMDSQALDHPLHTAMGNNGPPRMNLLGASGRTIIEEYIEQFGEEAYAEFDRELYIKLHGKEAYMARYGDLEAIGQWGTWEPCHKQMLGHGIVGVENLGGDLDKVSGKRFRFYCFPIRWYMGDGSMVRCVAEIDEDQVNKDVPDRTYTYCGTGYGPVADQGR